MRPKFLVIVLLCVIVAFALAFWLRPRTPVPPATGPSRSSVTESSTKTTNRYPSGVRSEATGSHSIPAAFGPPIDETTAKSNALKLREVQMKQAVEGQNVPVSFYGMVIDQNSNTLAGVRVTLGVRHNLYAIPNSLEAAKYAALSTEELQKVLNPTTEVVSGSDGRFQWTDASVTGDILGVGTLQKDGYEPEPGQYSCRAGDGNYNNPVIFKMWSTNIHERLITGSKAFDIVPDGRSYFINLEDDTIAELGTGDLKVWIKYTNQVVIGQLYDWSASIEVINGGLLEEKLGSPMYEAPTDGYVPAFQIKAQIKGGQRGNTGERQFYFRLRSGQEYGQMKIGLYAPFNNETPGLIRLSYAINPSGSRILR